MSQPAQQGPMWAIAGCLGSVRWSAPLRCPEMSKAQFAELVVESLSGIGYPQPWTRVPLPPDSFPLVVPPATSLPQP